VLAQLRDGDLLARRLAVRAVGGHRLVGVGDGQDARLDRDLIADQAEGIALAVGALVVREHPGGQVLELRMGEQARADLGMRADRVPLVGLQRARLAHQPIRYARLADVVHQPREPDALHALGLEAHLPRHPLGVASDRMAVAGVAGVAHVELLGQADHARQARLAAVGIGQLVEHAGDVAAVDDRAVAA
jgi:hypothetical protein